MKGNPILKPRIAIFKVSLHVSFLLTPLLSSSNTDPKTCSKKSSLYEHLLILLERDPAIFFAWFRLRKGTNKNSTGNEKRIVCWPKPNLKSMQTNKIQKASASPWHWGLSKGISRNFRRIVTKPHSGPPRHGRRLGFGQQPGGICRGWSRVRPMWEGCMFYRLLWIRIGGCVENTFKWR